MVFKSKMGKLAKVNKPVNEEVYIDCPYCGEGIWIEVDITGGVKQHLIEDCHICCRPIEIFTHIDLNGIVSVNVKTEDDV